MTTPTPSPAQPQPPAQRQLGPQAQSLAQPRTAPPAARPRPLPPFGQEVPGYGRSCLFCGSVPAVEATVRGHQGMVVMMRFLKVRAPFCRRCGIAKHREMVSDSLIAGWWSPTSLLLNPLTLLVNLFQRWKISRLPEPVPGAPGTPADPGRPVLLRPTALGLLIPVILIGGGWLALHNDPEYAEVGDCVHSSGNTLFPDVSVVDCGSAKAQYEVVGRFDDTTDTGRCATYPRTVAAFRAERGSTKYVLCLARNDNA
ncbi:LppU/SCO3897 family protein [Actinacidiphila sp. bgisy160]|uniref:LppU/SCO3897 family protein n=1 Tax=Actinacidiphila sp. bgisy160 TaxID=3413796 RepID=UPI003D7249B0